MSRRGRHAREDPAPDPRPPSERPTEHTGPDGAAEPGRTTRGSHPAGSVESVGRSRPSEPATEKLPGSTREQRTHRFGPRAAEPATVITTEGSGSGAAAEQGAGEAADPGDAPEAGRSEHGGGSEHGGFFGGVFDADEPAGSGRRGRRGRRVAGGPRRRRRWVWPVLAGVIVLAVVGGLVGGRPVWNHFFPPDYDGPGAGGSVVVEVHDGDSVSDIGNGLVDRDVIASTRALRHAAEDDPRGTSVSPGFYVLHHRMSAQSALNTLLDPASRLGRLDLRGGTQLDDTAGPDDRTVPGTLSLLAHAICAPEPSGTVACPTGADLKRVMATTDPAALGVPAWALPDVARADPARRLEGLILPGSYDVRPGASPQEALGQVVHQSVTRLEGTGLLAGAPAEHQSPYQVLVVASLVEREGIAPDFGKVARVIDNRLPARMPLGLDSTINFPLDHQNLLTTPEQRATPGPYNTYLDVGLPPTPIAAPSPEAIRAALTPDPGPWVYFVKCQTDGTSCFAVTADEHNANRRLAQDRKVY